MKIFFRVLGAALFLIFFGFALGNTQNTTLSYFPGYTLQAPLVLMLLGFFSAGAVLGILALTPTVFRHRRELNRHKKLLHDLNESAEAAKRARTEPPQPDAI